MNYAFIKPDCPYKRILFGAERGLNDYRNSREINHQEIAQRFFDDNPTTYWILFKNNQKEPLAFGEFTTRLEVDNQRNSFINFNDAWKRLKMESPEIFIYFQKPDIVDKIQHVNSVLVNQAEQEIINTLRKRNLAV